MKTWHWLVLGGVAAGALWWWWSSKKDSAPPAIDQRSYQTATGAAGGAFANVANAVASGFGGLKAI